MAPPRVGKTTMLGGVQAPKAPAADDSWDVAPTRIEERPPGAPKAPPAQAAVTQAVTPQAPAASPAPPPAAAAPPPLPPPPPPPPPPAAAAPAPTPMMPAVTHVMTAPAPAPAPAYAPTPTPAAARPPAAAPSPPGLTAADVRLVVRTLIEDSLGPVQYVLADLQRRMSDLERLAASAQARPAAAPNVVLSPAPPGVAASHSAYASAIAAPASLAPNLPPRIAASIAPAPPVDLAAIERDVPYSLDMRGFDGRARRRRNTILFAVALLVVFGGLFALLADSYTPHH